MTEAIAVTVNKDGVSNVGQIVFITAEETAKVQRYWIAIKKGAIQRRKQWLAIGQYLLNVKAEYAANNPGKSLSNQAFGEKRKEVFPDMEVTLASYAMTYAENHTEIDTWCAQHAPELATPAHMVKRWKAWKAQKDSAPRAVGSTGSTDKGKSPAKDGKTNPNQQVEVDLNFEDLARDGKVRINETAVKLNIGLNMILTYLKQGHRLETATLARFKNRLQAVLERLEVAEARLDQQTE